MPKGHMLFPKDYVDNIDKNTKDLIKSFINRGKKLVIEKREDQGWVEWDYYLDHPDFSDKLNEDMQYGLIIRSGENGKPYVHSLNYLSKGKYGEPVFLTLKTWS